MNGSITGPIVENLGRNSPLRDSRPGETKRAASAPFASALLASAVLLCAAPGTIATAAAAEDRSGPDAASRAAVDESTPVPVPEPSPLALRFYSTGNWLWALAVLWDIAVPAVILFTGTSARIRNIALRFGLPWVATVAVYVTLYTLLIYVVELPLHYYRGFVRLHAYGLSNQSFPKWIGDWAKAVAVYTIVGALFAWVPYLLILKSPRRWWLYTTLLTVPFLFGVVLLKPVWVDPLFNDFGPMKDRALEQQIVALAERAGISGGRIYEVNKSVDTKTVNAYVTGVFGTKRIVLWDTLLAQLEPREVLAVMGHEMGHYVLGHVPRSILLSTLITLVSLFFVDRAGRRLIARFHERFGFDRLSDVASVPLLMMLLQVSGLVLEPVANVYSRFQEHEADRFALELTRTNRSAALAFVKLQRENLGHPRPGLFYTLWRSTHPSIGARIDFCNEYHPWTENRPLRYARWFHQGDGKPVN